MVFLRPLSKFVFGLKEVNFVNLPFTSESSLYDEYSMHCLRQKRTVIVHELNNDKKER